MSRGSGPGVVVFAMSTHKSVAGDSVGGEANVKGHLRLVGNKAARRQASMQARSPLRTDGRACLTKRTWEALTGRWVPHDTRYTVVDFARQWSQNTEIAL